MLGAATRRQMTARQNRRLAADAEIWPQFVMFTVSFGRFYGLVRRHSVLLSTWDAALAGILGDWLIRMTIFATAGCLPSLATATFRRVAAFTTATNPLRKSESVV
jgi:hypothetical protein